MLRAPILVLFAMIGPVMSAGGTAEVALSAERESCSVYADVTEGLATSEAQPENCVTCMWHQRCEAGFHSADITTGGANMGAHYDCIQNPQPYWCSGHPLCGGEALLDSRRVTDLAIRLLDGDLRALRRLTEEFPDHLRTSADGADIEVLACPHGFAFATVPASEIGDLAAVR